jgi:diguanylate cyclase (GGDEF)-like protein
MRRLGTLHALGLLDTPAEERFDRITRTAQRVFSAPIALVSLVDEDRQWFKSRQGLDQPETPRQMSFCAHAILGDQPMVVTDAAADERFADNPLVQGEPHVRFYAGCPISAPDGSKLGSLCVIDDRPRRMTPDDMEALKDLASMVETEIAAIHNSIVDELTGLVNRRGFQLIGVKVLGLSARKRIPAVLVYADLDRLKMINDTRGHVAGDMAITDAAGLLADAFRSGDVVARLGGDEFAVLLSGTSGAGAPLDRLTQQVAAYNESLDEARRLSFSYGSATFDPDQPVSLEDLLSHADQAMYRYKNERR